MSKEHAELMEKAAFTIMALTKERDDLCEENSRTKVASDRTQALEDIKPLVPQNTDPEQYLDAFLDNGGSFEGIKEARRLLPNIGSEFVPADELVGDGEGSMAEVNRLVLGEL